MPQQKYKGVHTSPRKAGAKNLEGKDLPKDELGLNDIIFPVYKHGMKYTYNGQWSDEDLRQSIDDFFTYCNEKSAKPTQPLLRLWLGIGKSQFYEWRTKKEKYGSKSEIIEIALEYMESYLQGNLDKYPTGSIFLLKSSYGHSDATKIEITSTGTKEDEVVDMVAKLGLDKPKEE